MEIKKMNLIIRRGGRPRLELKKWMKLLAVFILAMALSLTAYYLVRSILDNPNVYHGVFIDGQNVGGMSPSELRGFIRDRYENCLDSAQVIFFTEDFEKAISYKELGISVNLKSMEEQALKVGREGFFAGRLLQISRLKKNPVRIPLALETDEAQLDTAIEDLNRYVKKDVTVPKVVIEGDQVTLCAGGSGWEVDKELLKCKVLESVKNLGTLYVHIPLRENPPPKIDIDAVYDAIIREPVNAEYSRLEDGSVAVKPQVNGRSIDKAELANIIHRAEQRELKIYEEIPLPVQIIEPQIKTRELEAMLFRDVLASASTRFSTSTANGRNRAINIRLAAETINGTILLPGEEFSFNQVVGPRTPEKGYTIAHVYIQGEVRDGYGGGVCQVSTTLYDAVLLANLKVTERHNHMFTVSYVPLGMDAAVSYGYADLKFKNTTDYPIRIDARVSDNNVLTFNIVGTNLYPNVRVKVVSRVISRTKATTQYIDDPHLAEGEEIVEEEGMDGAVVDTYIQIYSGNDLIKDYKIHQSVYQMLPRKVRRGTRKLAQETFPETE